MKRKLLRFALVTGALCFGLCRMLADVTVTEPLGGNDISADKSLNSTNGAAFTALGNIVLAEGSTTDFGIGNNRTLIFTLPLGWRFNTSAGSVSFAPSRDITAASISVGTDTVTVTLSVSGAAKFDTLTISGLQIQALDGSLDWENTGYILNLSSNPGTAIIAGVNQDLSTFGLLNTVPGTPRALAMNIQPSPTATAGVIFSQQPDLFTYDQFGIENYLDYSTIVTASRASGSGTLQGTTSEQALGGEATFSDLSINSVGTITILFTAPGLTSVTSDPITVGPGIANTLAFTTQPGSAASGVPFGIQPVIKSRDQFGNLSTVGLAAHLSVTMTLTSGAGPLAGTISQDIGTAAGNGTITYTDLEIDAVGTNKQLTASATGFSSALSSVFAVTGSSFSQLQVLLPGETAAPGTPTGKTGTPLVQTAGTAFNVTVNAVDANWNLINTVTDTARITCLDGNAVLPANAALVNGTKTFTVTAKSAGSVTVTASDVTDNTKTANTSSFVTVNPGAFAKLQILAPGETGAPGSVSGKTGTPSAQVAGAPFSVTVNAVDANWNVINTNDTVSVASSDGNALLPANAALVGGSKTLSVTLKTAGSATLTAADVTHAAIPSSTSPSIPVSAGAFTKLQILMPGETAAPGTPTGKTGTPSARTAGVAFNAAVNAVDANWNVVSTVADTAGVTSSDANAVLPVNAALVNGTQTFSVTLRTAGTSTLTGSDISDNTKSSNTSPSISVAAGAFAKVQILAPGETAVPGSANGKTGTPTGQTAGTAFNVTVNAVDANWNLVNTNDSVAITSSDPNAALPANAALVSGTKAFSVTLKNAGNSTVTASDTTHAAITSNTSSAITVNAGAFARLQLLIPGETAAPGTSSGKIGTPTAQSAGSAFNVTVNAVDVNWNVISSVSDWWD